jgi:hypothetical protein
MNGYKKKNEVTWINWNKIAINAIWGKRKKNQIIEEFFDWIVVVVIHSFFLLLQ